LGWKVGRGENDAFISPPKGNQTWMLPHWPPSIGLFPNATKYGIFHWPPNWGSFLTSFLPIFFNGMNLDHLAFYFRTWFSICIFKNLFLQLSLGREEWLVWIDGEKRDNRLDHSCTFERMKMSRGRFGAWNLREFS